MTSSATRSVDPVTMTVAANYLATVSREMGQALQNTAYSTVFNEALDFSCSVFDDEGELIGQGEFCPSQLAATTFAVKEILRRFGVDAIREHDVYLHNDPFSGMNHLPEHLVTKGVFLDGGLVGFVACIGHMSEVGGLAPGGFPGDAQEVFHEGLRIPPVRLVKDGVEDEDLMRVILANGRTPRVTAGDLRAMVGTLYVGERRLLQMVRRHGVDRYREIKDEIKRYAEERMRASIAEIPPGVYVADELLIDNDGVTDEPSRVVVTVTVDGDRVIVDFTGSDAQRRGPVNSTGVATICAVYNAILHLTDPDIPVNAGRYRPIEVVLPEASVVNAAYPAATVGGNTEVHPHIVTLIWKALAPAVPERVAAAASETWMLVTFGGAHPDTGEPYATLMLEAQGWGGRQGADGWDAVGMANGNCPLTPVEVLETRYPLLHEAYGLNEGSGGAGRWRGGMGTIRRLSLRADMTFSCYHSSEKLKPWGLFGGASGTLSSFRVKCPGDDGFATFKERFGVACASKFTNIRLPAGTVLEMTLGGAGGYGPAAERSSERIARDLLDGFCTTEDVRALYPDQADVALRERDAMLAALRASSERPPA
ncbi:MAG: N-methylhydantoinase [Solirubrobacteraceae bacterium]|nr:N-methylhydantoinase [Solirubrobacteraceae bacterium]